MTSSKGQKGQTRERILSSLTTSREKTLEEAAAGKCQTVQPREMERKVSMEEHRLW